MERNLSDTCTMRKRIIAFLYYIFALLLVATFLAGCFHNYITDPLGNATVQEGHEIDSLEEVLPQKGGEIRVPVPVPDTFNPLLAHTKGLSGFLGIMFEGLFELSEDQSPVPVLAHSWEVQEDGRVWHIKIREGVKFHDEHELTAEDVIFTFKALQEGILGSPYERGLVAHPDIETMVADENDAFAVYVHLFEPVHNMRELLTFPILPLHVYQSNAFMLENKGNFDFLPIGTGPFKADSARFDALSHLRVVRNQDWWGGEAYLESVLGLVYEDETLARAAFVLGEIDVFDSVELFASVHAIGRQIQRHTFVTSRFEFIGFNHAHPILSDLLVRRAIAHAIDRQQIITVVYNGNAQNTEAPVLPSSWLYRSGHGIFDADINKTSELLIQAGWTGVDENGIRFKETETGHMPMNFRLLTNMESGLRRHAQELIVNQLEAVGISVEVQILPLDEFAEALRTMDFDAVLTGYSVARFPDLSFNLYLGDGALPITFYESDALDLLMNEAAREYDQERLSEIYVDAQKYISEQLPVISLYFRTGSLLVDKSVKGIMVPVSQDIYRGIDKWHISR